MYLNFIRPSYILFYGFLQRTGAKPYIDHAEILWRSYRDEVSVAMHRNRGHGARSASVLRPRGDKQWFCDPRV